MVEHRSSMLDAPLRRRSDPSLSRDPRVRALVEQLKALPAPQLRTDFRDELRAQLVAITPRLVAEGAPAETPLTARAGRPARGTVRGARHAGVGSRAGSFALPRVASVAASLVVVLTLLLSGALLLSRNALPGDSLYGLKLGSERAQLAFDTTDSAKANDLLHFATTRVDEVGVLVQRSRASAVGVGPHGVSAAGGAIDAATAARIQQALARADSETKRGSQLLTGQAVADRRDGPLKTLSAWAKSQYTNIYDVWSNAPKTETALRNRMQKSLKVVINVGDRSTAVRSVLTKTCKPATTDDYGPVPSCSPTPSGTTPGTPAPGHSGTSAPSGSTQSPTSGPSASSRRPGQPGGPGASGAGTSASRGTGGSRPSTTTTSPKAGSSPSPSASPKGPIHLPTSLIPTKPPIVVGSCTQTIQLGPISTTVTICPPS